MEEYIIKIIELYNSLKEVNEKYKISEKTVKFTLNKIALNYSYLKKSVKFLTKLDINYDDYYFDHDEMMIDLLIKNYNNKLLVITLSKIRKYFYNNLVFLSNVTLNAENEINKKLKNIKYHCIICNDLIKKKSFEIYLIFYYFNSIFYKKDLFLGLDFEFNSKIIALMQINFEEPIIENGITNNFIFIIDPPLLKEKTKKYFIQNILNNQKIYKILHGSDSLDIPYLYYEFLVNEDYVFKFTNKLIDTKFLCEYYNIQKNKEEKCKIYHVLKNHKIISEKKFNQILNNEDKMGPIYDINININNLSNELILYTVYDVLFLKYLSKKFFDKGKIYKNIVPELTRLIFLERRNFLNLKEIIDSKVKDMNNYMIIKKNRKIRLNDLFKIKIKNSNQQIKNLLLIKYFSKTLILVLKYLFFANIQVSNDIYINKNDKLEEKLDINLIYKFFNQYKYIKNILRSFYKNI